MSINAPVLVLSAAALSMIAKGGQIYSKEDESFLAKGVVAGPVFKFWAAIGVASIGILAIDNYNHDLAVGLASLWIVGGILANGSTVSNWVGGLAQGFEAK